MQMDWQEVYKKRPQYDSGRRDDPKTNSTSHQFLCGMTEWWQGDYVDDAGLCDDGGACERADGVGIEYGIGPSDAKGIEDAPMQRFEILFRLGRHQEAADLMLAGALEPGNEYILDMYQIGYLCDGDELAGPVFELVEPDGTSRNVQFCELGK